MDAIDQILQYVKEKGHAPASQIIKDLALSRRGVFKNLARVVKDGKLLKRGKHPKTEYYWPTTCATPGVAEVPSKVETSPLTVGPKKEVSPAIPSTPAGAQSKATAGAQPEPESIDYVFIPLWLRWAVKDNEQADRLRNRFYYISGITADDYLKMTLSAGDKVTSATGRNLVGDVVRWIFESLTWLAAMVSIWIQQGWGKVYHQPKTASRKDVRPMVVFWFKIVILFVIGWVVGYYMHRIPPNAFNQTAQQWSNAQNELAQTKGQLADVQNQLAQTKEQLGQSQDQRKDLEGQVKAREAEIQQLQDQTQNDASLQNELNQTRQQLSNTQNELTQTKDQLTKAQAEHIGDTHPTASVNRPNGVSVPISYASPAESLPHTMYITMEQIAWWASQGVSSRDIIHLLQITHSTYYLQPSDIKWLRQHKVSEDVIKAMSATINK